MRWLYTKIFGILPLELAPKPVGTTYENPVLPIYDNFILSSVEIVFFGPTGLGCFILYSVWKIPNFIDILEVSYTVLTA